MRRRITWVAGLLGLAGLGFCAEPQAYTCRWEGGKGDKLVGGGSLETARAIMKTAPESVDSRFLRWTDAVMPGPADTNTAFFAVCNATGWLIGLTAQGAPGGSLDLYFKPETRDGTQDYPPYRFTIRLPDGKLPPPMLPVGFPVGMPSRYERTPPWIVEHPYLSAGHASRPLRDLLGIKVFPSAESGTVVTVFFPWLGFHDRLPFTTGKGAAWRLKLVRTLADGTVTAWGGPPYEADWGELRWPVTTDVQLTELYRQYFAPGVNPGDRYQALAAEAEESWTIPRKEAQFGDAAASAVSMEKDNPEGDAAFFVARVQPILDRNKDLCTRMVKPDRERPAPILGLKPAELRARLGDIDTLTGFKAEIEAARRVYLLDRLFERAGPLPPAPLPEAFKAPDITALDLDMKQKVRDGDFELPDTPAR